MGRTFADWMVESSLPENRFLEEMERVLPWKQIEALLAQELQSRGGGRPPYPLMMMMRMTLLQWWHGLSDAQTEFQCADRLSFRKFVGVGITDKIPDSTTLENFRHRLEGAGLHEKLLRELDTLLVAKGIIRKQGTLVDATFIEAARPKSDPDRKTGHKGNGYTASVSIERQSKLIRKAATTDAAVHDSQSLKAVLPEAPGSVYADLGYFGEPCKQIILETGGIPHIGYKKPRNKALEPWQKGVNTLLSEVRSPIEHVFARWKVEYKWKNSRYSGLKKVHLLHCGMAIAYNFQRLGFLLRGKTSLPWA